MERRKVIITGASGFVGKNLSAYLQERGYEVEPVSLRSEQWKTKIDPDAFAVIHLAGLAHDLKNANNPEDYMRVNAELTAALYDVYVESRIEKFIFFSSVKAVADRLGAQVLDETHLADPQTPYGKSKLKAEEYLLGNLRSGKTVYIIRPCMIHGPGNKGNLNLLYKMIEKGIPYPFAAFENLRSFLSIENLNFGVTELLLQPIASGVYNFADDVPIPTTEVIDIIYQGLGRKNKMLKISKRLIQILAKLGDKLPIPFDSERLKKLTESYVVSNRKITSAMGKSFPVSTQQGLLRTVKSFKQ